MPDDLRLCGSASERARAHSPRHLRHARLNCLDTIPCNTSSSASEERCRAGVRERGGLPDGLRHLHQASDRTWRRGRSNASCGRGRSLEEKPRGRLGLRHSPSSTSTTRCTCAHLSEIYGRWAAALRRALQGPIRSEEGLASAVASPPWAPSTSCSRSCAARARSTASSATTAPRSLNRQAQKLFEALPERGIAVFNAAPYASGVRFAKGSAEMPLRHLPEVRLRRDGWRPAGASSTCAPESASRRECGGAPSSSTRDQRVDVAPSSASTKLMAVAETLSWWAEVSAKPLWDAARLGG